MPTGLNASASAITTPKNRRIWLLLIYGPAQDRLATGGISRSLASGRGAPAPTALRLTLRPARLPFVHLVASRLAAFHARSPPGAGPQPQPPYGSPCGPLGSFGSHSHCRARSTARRQPS